MRMRRKKWARPELAACPYYIENAGDYTGRWNSVFSNGNPVFMELGCGKGSFLSLSSRIFPDINWLGLDIKSEMLAVARRTIERQYSKENLAPPENIRLVSQNIERILTGFSENDRIQRIYINFCNPWPRGKHNKRRLTHTRQLEQYKVFLEKGGEIRFKTDDDLLFEDSLGYFEDSGFRLKYLTCDLHSSDFEGNIETEHEKMFAAEGKTIKFGIFSRL